MRFLLLVLCLGLPAMLAVPAHAAPVSQPAEAGADASGPLEVTAGKSLEWYQKERLYVARGDAKAVRGDLTVEADILTAHETAPPPKPTTGKPAAKKAANARAGAAPAGIGGIGGTGDIDQLTAAGNVRIAMQKGRAFGDRAVYDLAKHVAYLTGKHLRYETDKETVTARDSLEYWDQRQLAVARGDAVAVQGDRKVVADILSAQFRTQPNGQQQMHTLTAAGHVAIVTKGDVARCNHAVYDVPRNIAILTGHVRITRPDGTQLNGDVAEMDFASGRSRLLNEGKGTRVRLLLPAKNTKEFR